MVSRSFVILVISVLAIAALAFAVMHNPSADEHRAEIRGASPGSLAAGVAAYHSLRFVSYTEIGGRVVSIGLFGIVFVSSVALIQVALAIGALLIATGIFRVAAKRVHLVKPFSDRIFRVAAKRVHLAKPFWDRSVRSLKPLPDGLKTLSYGYWRFPFALGIAIPIVVSDWFMRMLDFGTLFYGGPAAGGLVFSAAAIFAAMRSRLRSFLVALPMFAGVPIGCIIHESIQSGTLVPDLKTILTQVVYWWVIGVIPTILGVGLGAASRKNLSESR